MRCSHGNGPQRLGTVTVPVHVIYGSADPGCYPSYARALYDGVGHARKQITGIAGAARLDGQPEEKLVACARWSSGCARCPEQPRPSPDVSIPSHFHGDSTVKALVLRQHGGLEQLEVVADHPRPAVTDEHVVIRVRASSFNYHDVFTVRGMPGIKVPLPVVIGLDMAGEIVETGAGVDGWKAGDRVLVNPLNKKKGLMGEMMDGGMAEYCWSRWSS